MLKFGDRRKLSEEDIDLLFEMLNSGVHQAKVAEHFGLTQGYISLVANGLVHKKFTNGKTYVKAPRAPTRPKSDKRAYGVHPPRPKRTPDPRYPGSKGRMKPCSVDGGKTIYPSLTALMDVLGKGYAGGRSPNLIKYDV
jgi:hypothetical protein